MGKTIELGNLVKEKYGEGVELKFERKSERITQIQVLEKKTGRVVRTQMLFGGHPDFEAVSEEMINSIKNEPFA
jgi:ribosomal protein L19